MARSRGALRILCAVAVAAALAACAKQDGSILLGQWHAERFDVEGLKLPIGPDLAIARDKLSTGNGDLGVTVTAIEQEGDEVVLDVSGGIGLTFHMIDADRMYVQIPFIPVLNRIYYRRVGNAVVAPAPATVVAAVAAPATAPAPIVAAPTRRPGLAADVESYALALQAARQGQRDAALRYLHQAVREGFDRADVLHQEPAFAALQSDPRYQVIVGSMRTN